MEFGVGTFAFKLRLLSIDDCYSRDAAIRKDCKKIQSQFSHFLNWQCLDTRQLGTDVSRINTRKSKLFEGFRREGLF